VRQACYHHLLLHNHLQPLPLEKCRHHRRHQYAEQHSLPSHCLAYYPGLLISIHLAVCGSLLVLPLHLVLLELHSLA
jgi:hypothetical protein